ncbi:FAD-dependent oxidoreductase [Vibrio harveyi]|nr:FAD-dependent oxidoreductase [Vibrio harveyi]
MRDKVKSQKNLDLITKACEGLLFKDKVVSGVIFDDGSTLKSKVVIITTGTYLKSEILKGVERCEAGPNSEKTTKGISKSLLDLGLKLLRFKTGTPARVYRDSVDLSNAVKEPGTDMKLAFSFSTNSYTPLEEQELCYLIHSTPETKKIIEDNLEKSAMYSGTVESIGPRYCPSFEDKIVRFKDKETHQIFIEPETLNGDT